MNSHEYLNISKYWEFEASKALVLDPKSNTSFKYGTNIFLLNAITNKKTVKLMQIDRIRAASKIFPTDPLSYNSGRYTLHKPHIHYNGSLSPGLHGKDLVN